MKIGSRSARAGRAARPRRSTLGLALVLAAWTGLAFALGAATQKTGFFRTVIRPLVEGGVKAPLLWARARLTAPVRLEIDVKFEDLRKLHYLRERALEREAVFMGEDDEVPAMLSVGDEQVRIRMRLKGDSISHLMGDKWSFRVDVRRGGTVLGMRRFSLHHPAARNYVGEWIYHRALRREGVMALRYEFVEVSLNGESLGIYALEEHFDKRLVEHNRRREGPILRFDEELMWRQIHAQYAGFDGTEVTGYGDYEASAIDGFRSGSMLKDPVLRGQFLDATAQLEAFRRGERTTGEVFDVDRLATFYAVSDLLGAEHGTRWHNLRLYWNPVTRRLEPIGFDGSCAETRFLVSLGPLDRDERGRMSLVPRPFVEALFADMDFYRRYLSELERFADPAWLDGLFAEIAADLDLALLTLHREFPQVRSPRETFERNRRYIGGVLGAEVAVLRAFPDLGDDGELLLRAGNLQTLPLEIVGLRTVGAGGAPRVDLETPLVLPPRPLGDLVTYRAVPLPLAAGAGEGGELLYRVLGTRNLVAAPLLPYALPMPGSGLLDATRRPGNVAAFDFLTADPAGGAIDVRPGAWRLDTDLVIPAGTRLRASAGTRLDLVRGARIVSRSPLEWVGNEPAPIEVVSSDGTGRGLVVLQAGEPSTLRHVRFAGLRVPADDVWSLTGAVTFYESPLVCDHCTFVDNRAEDALNVVRASYRLDEATFRGATSDAFDGDFTEGEITNSRFLDQRNDAIDVSGSTLQLDHVTVVGAGDKGLSAGEQSQVRARLLSVERARVGLASKDRSTVTASDLTLRGCRWALAAFQKKSEFGPAAIEVSGFETHDMTVEHLIEEGSRASVDGRSLPTGDRGRIREILYGEPDERGERDDPGEARHAAARR